MDRWIRRHRKRRPAGTTLEAKESLPMRERSSLLVADLFSYQHLMIAAISCNLGGGGGVAMVAVDWSPAQYLGRSA